jgi:hypothetical protein
MVLDPFSTITINILIRSNAIYIPRYAEEEPYFLTHFD